MKHSFFLSAVMVAVGLLGAGCSGAADPGTGDDGMDPGRASAPSVRDPGARRARAGRLGEAAAPVKGTVDPGQVAVLSCGNGICDGNEDCEGCPEDCGACSTCAHPICQSGDMLDGACDPCAASICQVDDYCCTIAWDGVCVSEVITVCGQQCAPPVCGDGVCDGAGGEWCGTCPSDCGACAVCGDGVCDPNGGESCWGCPGDCGACATCGDGVCDPNGGEWCGSCPGDCGACAVCGDGVCDANGGEMCATCPADCGSCGSCSHDTCTMGGPLDASCGTCEAQVCAQDSFCCTGAWDSLCRQEAGTICGTACSSVCGDFICDAASESCGNCPNDCGACVACGDGLCQAGESCGNCAADCGACPGLCDHGVCDAGTALDASCDACTTQVCQMDAFCCLTSWDTICVSEVASICGQTCP